MECKTIQKDKVESMNKEQNPFSKINWFPGHMAKAMRKTEEDVKLCDGVIYVLDARAPYACINKRLMRIFSNKPIVYALNKSDLIEKKDVDAIVSGFKAQNLTIRPLCGINKKDTDKLKSDCQEVLSEKLRSDKEKGINRTLRFMVAGIPNTGKSTIINTLVGSKRAETGDKAGITRANKWIRVGGFELLDTPGTMPPSMENQTHAEHLAFIGAINDDILNTEDIAVRLLAELKRLCPEKLSERYNLKTVDNEPIDLFNDICKARGYVLKGGEYDYERGAKSIISDFRKGKIGKVCLEVKND